MATPRARSPWITFLQTLPLSRWSLSTSTAIIPSRDFWVPTDCMLGDHRRLWHRNGSTQSLMFQDLPPEVLCGITSLLRAHYVYRIWLSGSKRLQMKLGKGGGACNFELVYPSEHLTMKRLDWPSLVSSLSSLTSFTFEYPVIGPGEAIYAAQLLQLPASLRSLTLNFSSCLYTLCDAMALPQFDFPNLTALDVNTRVTLGLAPSKLPIRWPKTLLSLKVKSTCLELRLEYLPLSLTLLSWDACQIEPTDTPFPQSIADLALKLQTPIPLNLLELLPSNLSKLSLYTSNGSMLKASEWNWSLLPRQLQTLEMSVADFKRDHCAQLPPSLTRLVPGMTTYAERTDAFIDVLPPGLKYVENMIPFRVSKALAIRLPRSLEQWPRRPPLDPLYAPQADADALPYLPPNTQHIVCTSLSLDGLATELQALRVRKIPIALKMLRLHQCSGLDSLDVLPSESLQALHLLSGPLPHPAVEYFAPLSSFKMTTLDIVNIAGDDRIPQESWGILPRTLTALYISCPDYITANSSQLLPRYLEILEIASETDCTLHLDWFKGLPETLVDLCMAPIETIVLPERYQYLYGEDLENFMQQEASANVAERIRFDLPPNLRDLFLFFNCSYPWIIPSLLVALPSKLFSCTLGLSRDADSHVRDSDLDFLPKRLKYLEFPESVNFSEERREEAANANLDINYCIVEEMRASVRNRINWRNR